MWSESERTMVENIVGSTVTPRDKNDYLGVTKIECPSCKNDMLHVVSDIEDSIHLECRICRYTEHKPSNYIEYVKFDGHTKRIIV
ncbi:hypothetical protein LCGC14_1760540 [marine sediment metagenome]|uniref:Uncharacterized protein n=1 Tax=marine sediment metagenome TaxID=412755 RepID=A0A0F9HNK2_9ZZZZ